MFAFVFSNGTDLWFASDIFGEQPLYFYHGGTRGFFPCLSIASEMKQLLVCGALLNKIKPCAPGKLYHYSFATGALEVETYHAFDYTQARTDVVDYEKIRKLLRRSCKKKYGAVALQQTALLLSGGVDSAIIAYELSKLGITQAFTVSIDLDSIDFRTAEVAAAQCGLHLTKVLCKTLDPDRSIVMSESKNRSVVEEYVCHLALAKCLAEQNYRVVFTGSGADEIFVGYPYYLRFFSRNNMSLLQSKLIESYHSRELRVLNKVYMSYAIECRSPFLDRTLANYALTLDINKCLVDKGRMKAALRDAYCDVIASAQNEKIIAGRSMGVIDYFAERNGGMDARVYHPRYAEIFSSVGEVFGLLEKVRAVEYEIV